MISMTFLLICRDRLTLRDIRVAFDLSVQCCGISSILPREEEKEEPCRLVNASSAANGECSGAAISCLESKALDN